MRKLFSLQNTIYGGVVLLSGLFLSSCEYLPIDPFTNATPRERPAVVVPIVSDKYEKYESITFINKTLLLNEEFSNNNRKWKTSGNSWYKPYYWIDGDYLNLLNQAEIMGYYPDPASFVNTINLPELTGAENFEIEASIETEIRYSSYSDLFIWGATTTNPQKRLSWTTHYYSSYDVRIGKYDGQHISENAYKIPYDRIYREFNKITIRQIGNTCYFFLNEAFITKQTAFPFYGTHIGFQAGSNTSMVVDYLRVNKLIIK